MWSVEKVEKIATTQSQTPAKSASDGQRYARQRRCRKTAGPTIASASRTSPRKRKPAANSQWAISARGILGSTALPLEILDQARRDEQGEREPDDHDEQRRLDEPVPEILSRPGRRT